GLRLSGTDAGSGRQDQVCAEGRESRLLSDRIDRIAAAAGRCRSGPAGLSRHHQRGERLFRRRQIHDRKFRERQRAVVRALRPRLRTQASARDAKVFEPHAAAALRAVLAKRYAGSTYVSVMPLDNAAVKGGRLEPEALNGSNKLELYVFAS